MRYAYAPRFVLSCTDELLREVGVQAKARGLGIHTHASENTGEIALVHARYGKPNMVVLDELGLLGPHTCIAHAIHVSADERALLAARGAHVCTCPSSNLKLASGICGVPELIAAGVAMAIGADGAPCNNNLDGLHELRLVALLHKVGRGPRTLPAHEVVRMATLGGAAALGLEDQLGSLAVGKRGDVIAVDVAGLHAVPAQNPWSQIAYAARAPDVRHVAVDGRVVVRDRALLTLDVEKIRANARAGGQPAVRLIVYRGRMKLLSTVCLTLALATTAHADTFDTSKFLAWFDTLANTVVADQNDCPKMATDINKSIDDNKAMLDQAQAAHAAGQQLPPADVQRMRDSVKKMSTAIAVKCGHDDGVQAAIKRMPGRQH